MHTINDAFSLTGGRNAREIMGSGEHGDGSESRLLIPIEGLAQSFTPIPVKYHHLKIWSNRIIQHLSKDVYTKPSFLARKYSAARFKNIKK